MPNFFHLFIHCIIIEDLLCIEFLCQVFKRKSFLINSHCPLESSWSGTYQFFKIILIKVKLKYGATKAQGMWEGVWGRDNMFYDFDVNDIKTWLSEACVHD